MKYIFILILLFTGINFIQAQDYSKASDCSNAIDLSTFKSGRLPAPKGYGNVKEIQGFNLKSKHFFTEEHNTYWFEATFEVDTKFEMILTPEYADDDYDFLIFYDSTGNFCDDVANKAILPVRTNMSRVNPEQGSITGLKSGARKIYEVAGKGDAYSKPLYTVANQKYYVVVDAPYGAEGGFILELFYNGKNKLGESLESRQDKIIQKRSRKGRKKQSHNMFIEIRSQEDSTYLEDVDMSLYGLSDEDEVVYENGRYELKKVNQLFLKKKLY